MCLYLANIDCIGTTPSTLPLLFFGVMFRGGCSGGCGGLRRTNDKVILSMTSALPACIAAPFRMPIADCSLSSSSILHLGPTTLVICMSDRPITPSAHRAGKLSEGKTIWGNCAFHTLYGVPRHVPGTRPPHERCSILQKSPNGNGTVTERVFNGYPLKTR